MSRMTSRTLLAAVSLAGIAFAQSAQALTLAQNPPCLLYTSDAADE